MTTLGKVLAILNLVLAVFVGAFIIMSYVARTNWHAAYDKANNELKVTGGEFGAYQQEITDAQKKAGDVQGKLDASEKARQAEKTQFDEQIKALNGKLNGAEDGNRQLQASLDRSSAEIKRRDDELASFKAQLAKRDTELKDMEKRNEDMQAEATDNRIAARAEHERNERLVQENERLTKVIQQLEARLGGTGTAPRGPTNPPPEDVEGVVKATDPQSGYVTLSIGSDAGLSKGNTLEVYRLRPDPAYLGTVQILAVRHNEAVAKPIRLPRGPIQIGDQVASRITSGRH